jgi:hypothetical protein
MDIESERKCDRCKKVSHIDDFMGTKGAYVKRCLTCRTNTMCVHKKRRDRCDICNPPKIDSVAERKCDMCGKVKSIINCIGARGGYIKSCQHCVSSLKCDHMARRHRCDICNPKIKINNVSNVIESTTERKCIECKKVKSIDIFMGASGKYIKTCQICVTKRKCDHGRVRSVCKDCKGGAICVHECVRSVCKDCGGGSICDHGRVRSVCKDCGGGSICDH